MACAGPKPLDVNHTHNGKTVDRSGWAVGAISFDLTTVMTGYVDHQRGLFTGGPGAGKTTVLTLLRARGFFCVEEVARKIIQTRIQQGLSPRPAVAEFAAEIFAADVIQYDQNKELSNLQKVL